MEFSNSPVPVLLWCPRTKMLKKLVFSLQPPGHEGRCHWLREWLVASQHQAITWSNVDLSSVSSCGIGSPHNDVIKWKHFPCYWPFVRGINPSPVNSLHKGQWRGALMFSVICTWTNDWVYKQLRCRWLETPSHSLWRHCIMLRTVSLEMIEIPFSEILYLWS